MDKDDVYSRAALVHRGKVSATFVGERLLNKVFARVFRSHAMGRLVMAHFEWEARAAAPRTPDRITMMTQGVACSGAGAHGRVTSARMVGSDIARNAAVKTAIVKAAVVKTAAAGPTAKANGKPSIDGHEANSTTPSGVSSRGASGVAMRRASAQPSRAT